MNRLLTLGIPGRTGGAALDVLDTFNRADNNATLGVATTGQAWSTVGGTWGIAGDQALVVSTSGATTWALLDAGVSDCQVTVEFTWQENQGLVARYDFVTKAHLLLRLNFQNLGLFKTSDGATYTQLANFNYAPGFQSRHWMTIRMKGPSIQCFLDGTQRFDVSDSDQQNFTGIGMRDVAASTVARYDNLKAVTQW